MGVLRRRRRQDLDIFGKDELEGFEGLIDMLKPPGAVATFRDGGEDEERRVAWRCVGGDSGESEWWVAGVGGGCVEWGMGKRRRHWPGGGRGGIPLLNLPVFPPLLSVLLLNLHSFKEKNSE